VPSFILGIYLIIFLAVGMNLFPSGGQQLDDWRAWVLPTIALGVAPAAYIAA